MKTKIIVKLVTVITAFATTLGAQAEISLGNTYSWGVARYKDGWFSCKMYKSSGIAIYTGMDIDAGKDHRMLIEVLGAPSENAIKPIVDNLGFDGILTVTVWTDKEVRNKAMPPSSTMSDWDDEEEWVDDRIPGDVSGYPGNGCRYAVVGHQYETDDFEYE